MEPYDTQFQNRPVAFCDQHALLPSYGLGEQGASLKAKDFEDGGSYKVDDTIQDFPVLRAYGHCRVAFATIVKERVAGKNVKNGYMMSLFRQLQRGRFPIYWLPYDASGGRSSMIKLKPSKKVAPETPGRDPDLFITDALNGCTVTISGTAAEPIVYHSPQNQSTIRTSVEDFHAGYEQRKLMDAEQSLHWGNNEYGAFFPESNYKGRDGNDLLDVEEARFERFNKAKRNTLKLNEGATVIGQRHEGAWRFYCQEWIHFVYEWGLWTYSEKMVRRCYKIWPIGVDPPETATVFVGTTQENKGHH